jgi:hypothetical protein
LHEASDRLCVIFPRRHPLAARRKIGRNPRADERTLRPGPSSLVIFWAGQLVSPWP